MKNLKKHGTMDLEVLGLISGLVIVACFVAMFIDVQNSRFFMNAAMGMGIVLNGAIAARSFSERRKSQGSFFAVVAVLLLVILVLRLFLVKR